MVCDPTGNAAVSYGFRSHGRQFTTSLRLARRIAPNDWSTEIIDDSDGEFNYTSLAYNPSGNPSISYRLWPYKKQKNPGLKFAYWDGSSWNLEMVDPGVGDLRHGIGNSLAYDPATGEATIAYQRRDGTLRFFRRNFITGFWSSELVTVGDLLGDVSLAYDPASGDPSIAFQVRSPDTLDIALKFARWDGSSWVIEDVDTLVSISSSNTSSLAYDAGGTAYISYTTDEGAVKLARRNGGPDNNDWDVDEVVTSCVEAGPTSLKFDPIGNPSIGYSDFLNEKLKFARIVP